MRLGPGLRFSPARANRQKPSTIISKLLKVAVEWGAPYTEINPLRMPSVTASTRLVTSSLR